VDRIGLAELDHFFNPTQKIFIGAEWRGEAAIFHVK